MQPELTGTASTVARRFTVLGARGRNLLALAAVIGVAAIVLIAGTAFQKSRAAAAAAAEDNPAPSASAEAPPEPSGVPLGAGAATGVVTAPVHMAGAENESPPIAVQGGVAVPQGTVLSASPLAQPSVTAAASAAPSARRPPATAPHTGVTAGPRKPGAPGVQPVKPSLPPGLPRERQ
jgi:hypothetical protein